MISTPKDKRCSVPVLLVAIILLQCLAASGAAAVRSPEHYDQLARASAIQAIAVVQEVKVLEESKQLTRKEVLFRLEKALAAKAPPTFRGRCSSVDHGWQNPETGGTIYYYPQEGSRVLVTVSGDGGPITSYTILSPELENEALENKLTNISFLMGRATVKKSAPAGKKSWFTFHLGGKAAGYLAISQKKNPAAPLLVDFVHELLVGELDQERHLYQITTQARDDETLTPEWLTIEVTNITPEKTTRMAKREIGFRSVAAGNVLPGILVSGNQDAVEVGIPPETTSDLLLFSLVERRPFASDRKLTCHLIETLELHLKKDIVLNYQGKDPKKENLHRFVQRGAAQASYWLDEDHELQEVHWDQDKVFRRSTAAEAGTIFQ